MDLTLSRSSDCQGLSKGRWGVGVRVHILYPSYTLALEEGTQGYTNTFEIFEG